MRLMSLSLLATVLGVTIGLGALLSIGYQKYLDATSSRNTLSVYQQMSLHLAQLLSASSMPDVLIHQWNQQPHLLVELEDSDAIILPRELQSSFDSGQPIALETHEGIVLYTPIPDQFKMLLLHIPPGDSGKTSIIEWLLTCAFYGGVLMAMWIWLAPLMKRLKLLDSAAKNIASGQLAVRIPTQKTSYIYRIETTFNAMARQIEQLVADNKLLSRAVSHDLKTPLARLRFGVDMLEEEDNNVTREDYHQRIQNDLAHMESLINTLLDYAKFDEAQMPIDTQRMDLSQALSMLLSELPMDDHVQISKSIEPALTIDADPRFIAMLFQNLFTNAQRHARSCVHVSLARVQGNVVMTIADDGSGVDAADAKRIFQPFQRGAKSVPSDTKHHGMGLAICARIVEWFDAKIDVGRSERLGGAEFTVCFRADLKKSILSQAHRRV